MKQYELLKTYNMYKDKLFDTNVKEEKWSNMYYLYQKQISA